MKLYPRLPLVLLLFFLGTYNATAQLHAAFSATSNSGCAPLITHFHDASAGHPVSWHWVLDTLSPADTSNLANPNWIYSSPGYYTVKLIVTDRGGQKDSTTIPSVVYVSNPPIVNFVGSDTILSCPPQTIHFTNLSDTGGCSPYYTWFIDSATIHATDADYTFHTPGIYNISLRLTDSCGCSAYLSKSAYVKIDSFPSACFYTNDTISCYYPATICYNNCATPGQGYYWSFGDGTHDTLPSPCHTYSTYGVFSDTLTVTSRGGCATTVAIPNYVFVAHNDIAPIIISPSSPCINVSITCSDTISAAFHHYWHFYYYGRDTFSYDPTPTFFCDTSGVYTLTDSLWDSYGCHVMLSRDVNVRPSPSVFLSGDHPYRCEPNDTVTFTATTTDSFSIVYHKWIFDYSAGHVLDSSFLSNPTFIYTSPGFYTPSVEVRDSMGCSFKSSDIYYNGYIVIEPSNLISGLNVNPYPGGCVPLTVNYNAAIIPSGYVIDSVVFGDGTPNDTAGSGTHIYTRSGYFPLVIHYHFPSAPDCNGFLWDTVRVGNHPIFSPTIVPDTACPLTPIHFTLNCINCQSTDWWGANNAEFAHLGDLGDTASLFYYRAGKHKTIVLLNDSGCIDTAYMRSFTYHPGFDINVNIVNCADRFTYQFSLDSFTTSVLWHFGDGDTSTLLAPIHTFPSDSISWLVTMHDSSSLHQCHNENAFAVPIAPFPARIDIVDTSICPDQLAIIYTPRYDSAWVFWGDGSFDIQEPQWGTDSFSHTYGDPGRYDITIYLSNYWHCRDTLFERSVLYREGPGGHLVASPAIGCAPLTVNIADSNEYFTGVHVGQRLWQVIPGSPFVPGLSIDTTVIYPEGAYIISIQDTDLNGCRFNDAVIVVATKPHAFFTTPYTLGCQGSPIPFNDTNTHVSYRWYFGDGSPTATIQNPTHVYSANGTYTDTVVIITTAGGAYPVGCIDTMIRTDYVSISDTSIHVGFTLSDTLSSCPPFLVLLDNTTRAFATSYYKWKYGFDSTTIDFTMANATALYTFPGTYVITLIDSNSIGCRDSLKRSVHIGGPRGRIDILQDSICAPGNISLHVTNLGISPLDSFYSWFIPPYGAFTTDTPGITLRYTAVGTYNPYVVIDSNGCQVEVHTRDSIHSYSAPVLTVSHPPMSCVPHVLLTVSGGLTYTWSPASTLSCNTCDSTYAVVSGATRYTVIATNIHGCHDTASTTVVIDPPRNLVIDGNHNVCIGKNDTLHGRGVFGTYTWSGPGLSCITCPDVVTTFSVSAVYTVVTTDTVGCHDTATFIVDVRHLPNIYIDPWPIVICAGQYFPVRVQGAATYSWRPNTNITCDTCGITSLFGANNIFYTVTATSIYGCVNDSEVPVTVIQKGTYDLGPDTAICPGQSVQIHAGGGSNGYIWVNPVGLSANNIASPWASPESTTVYQVIVKENICFEDTGYIKVTVEQFPKLRISPDVTILAGNQVQLRLLVTNQTHVTQYEWSPSETLSCFNCPDPIATPVATTTYSVHVTTLHGCATDTSVTIHLYCDRSEVFIPNTFTPNGDGINDQFYVSGKGIGEIKRMAVYNRWGEVVFYKENFSANEPTQGWDGTFHGAMMPPDNFIYLIDVECELGNVYHFQGDISIVR